MFRAIILPIFRSTRLCFTACGKMHPWCCRPATSWVHYATSCNTQSSAPEDGWNYRPKHVELIGFINKLLLLRLVGCLFYLYQWCTVQQTSNFISSSNVYYWLTNHVHELSKKNYVFSSNDYFALFPTIFHHTTIQSASAPTPPAPASAICWRTWNVTYLSRF